MYYGAIKKYDIANGEGVRLTLFVSGCTNHCKGCFQPQTWDFSYGEPYTEETEAALLKDLADVNISGLTLLGGEPFEIENQRVLVGLLRKAKALFPEKNVWCYTGFVYDRDLAEGGKRYCEVTDEMLSLIDVLVDGPFQEAEKDIRLAFRGSRNQRVLDLKQTIHTGTIVYWQNGIRRD
ncbi:MAG: anaerobic ribonucleoside-triphosphate reductase activating protein [Solobacterium sp.]|nr:anaerobic ribonucleoside-triphosphate reductase activating protein [Solobacterium sp.]